MPAFPIGGSDDDVEEEEYEESFIDDSDDTGGPRPSVVPTARFEDIVAWMELQVRRQEPPEHLAEYLKGAEAAYRKLAQDMQLLASQAEAGWCKGFARLVKRVHSARISVDPTKSRTRKKGVCGACGVTEYLSPKRLDLVGNFPMGNFCRQAWTYETTSDDDPVETFFYFEQLYTDERHPASAGSKEDHGLFYLGTTCLRKFEASFMLRTFVSDLFMDIARVYYEAEKKRGRKLAMPTTQFATGAFGSHGFEFHPAIKDLFDAYPERRQLLELATGCQRVEPPVLTVDAELFAAVDAKREGIGADALYARGLEAIEQRRGEHGDEDERGAPEAAEDACGERARGRGGRGERRSEAGPSWDNGKAPQVVPPKKRARRVAPSDDDDTEEEAPAASPILEVAPAAPAAARSKALMPSGVSLAALSRADGELPSAVKAIAGLHQLAGQLLTQGQQREAGIVAAGAFTAQTLLEKLEHARAR